MEGQLEERRVASSELARSGAEAEIHPPGEHSARSRSLHRAVDQADVHLRMFRPVGQ